MWSLEKYPASAKTHHLTCVVQRPKRRQQELIIDRREQIVMLGFAA
jgi:hypothetical protein